MHHIISTLPQNLTITTIARGSQVNIPKSRDNGAPAGTREERPVTSAAAPYQEPKNMWKSKLDFTDTIKSRQHFLPETFYSLI